MLVIKKCSFGADHACDHGVLLSTCDKGVFSFEVDYASDQREQLLCCSCILSLTHIHTNTKGVILHGKYKSRRGLVVFPLSLAKVLNWLLTECLRKELWNSSLFAIQHPSLHRPMLFPTPYGSFHQNSVRNLELSYTPHLLEPSWRRGNVLPEVPRATLGGRTPEQSVSVSVVLLSCKPQCWPWLGELNPNDPKEDGSEGGTRCDSGPVWMKTSQ
ncbi:hypothetical protein TIFTF001_034718 [Ficus carica]|uniref:Uncharacterized protein n=1 Tax=Ficus carica TaxID=3494 RepID=A0AA88E3E4_FICCA|nr:hypothetical protein TIFTF001_034718 [Ficus carica]